MWYNVYKKNVKEYNRVAHTAIQRLSAKPCAFNIFNTLSAISAPNACLPKTEISVFVTESVLFSNPHVTNYICSHCMMCYTVRKKKCSIIVWFSQFIMTVQ